MERDQELIGIKELESIRKALKYKYYRDLKLKDYLKNLREDKDISPTEKEIVGYAYEEVQRRIYYLGLLDSLWNQIDEVQQNLFALHVYDSLEKGDFFESCDTESVIPEEKYTDIEIVQASLEERKFDDEQEDIDDEDSEFDTLDFVKHKKKKDKKKKNNKKKKKNKKK